MSSANIWRKVCLRHTVRYRWTGPGLTSILAGEWQGTNGLSHVTATEIISILKAHAILLFQNEDRVKMFVHFFWCGVAVQSGSWAPHSEVSISHKSTHHTRYGSSGRGISSSQRPLPDKTQHSIQTNIHAPGGIQPKPSASESTQTYACLSKIRI